MTNTAERYFAFAAYEARGVSPVYEAWATGVSMDNGLLELIEELPERKRQPNLVFGAARFLGAESGPYEGFREWMAAHWNEVLTTTLSRSTQTNEAGRTAVLLPALASIPGSLALIEVGASAGLCLYPDRYSYRYNGHPQLDPVSGPSSVVIECTVTGAPPIPIGLPDIVQRAGVDLNPLHVADQEEMRWLEALIWPEDHVRRDRLRAAIGVALAEPPAIVAGDLNESVVELVARVPKGVTPVVFHSAVLAYINPDARLEFERTVRALPCRWISNEGTGVIESMAQKLPRPAEELRSSFLLALDGEPVALAGPHGQSLDWFGVLPGE